MIDDSRAVRSLAERLLVHMTGMEGGPMERGRLIVGALADELSVELPIPDAATIVGSAVAPTPWAGPDRTETRTILELALDPADALAAVAEAATRLGWSTLERLGHPEMGGFVSWPDLSRMMTLCRGRRGPALDVAAAAGESGGSEVRRPPRDAGRVVRAAAPPATGRCAASRGGRRRRWWLVDVHRRRGGRHGRR